MLISGGIKVCVIYGSPLRFNVKSNSDNVLDFTLLSSDFYVSKMKVTSFMLDMVYLRCIVASRGATGCGFYF